MDLWLRQKSNVAGPAELPIPAPVGAPPYQGGLGMIGRLGGPKFSGARRTRAAPVDGLCTAAATGRLGVSVM